MSNRSPYLPGYRDVTHEVEAELAEMDREREAGEAELMIHFRRSTATDFHSFCRGFVAGQEHVMGLMRQARKMVAEER